MNWKIAVRAAATARKIVAHSMGMHLAQNLLDSTAAAWAQAIGTVVAILATICLTVWTEHRIRSERKARAAIVAFRLQSISKQLHGLAQAMVAKAGPVRYGLQLSAPVTANIFSAPLTDLFDLPVQLAPELLEKLDALPPEKSGVVIELFETLVLYRNYLAMLTRGNLASMDENAQETHTEFMGTSLSKLIELSEAVSRIADETVT